MSRELALVKSYMDDIRNLFVSAKNPRDASGEALRLIATANKHLNNAEPDAMPDGNFRGQPLTQDMLRAELLRLEGSVYVMRAQESEAINVFNKAIELHPENDNHHAFIAQAYFARGDVDKAIDAIKQAISLNPEHIEHQKELDQYEGASRIAVRMATFRGNYLMLGILLFLGSLQLFAFGAVLVTEAPVEHPRDGTEPFWTLGTSIALFGFAYWYWNYNRG